jgi:hypothetical protein
MGVVPCVEASVANTWGAMLLKALHPRFRYQPPAAMLNGLHCAKGLAARSALGAWCRNCTNPNTMR